MTDSALLPPAIAPEADGDGWDEPPAAPTGAPVLSAGGFEGPLDWLLDMVRSRRIDLARLPIAALIGSFADALETALARSDGSPPVLSRWGDWLVMAATLAQLRSRLLLPVEAPEAKAALREAEAMRRQLVGRAQIGAVADWLERQPQLGRDMFRRGRPESHPSNHGAEITDLLRACLALLQVPEEPEVYRIRPLPFWGVAQAIERIEALLAARPAGGELGAFVPLVGEPLDRDRWCRAAVASTLVASLELARRGTVSVEQDASWNVVRLSRATPVQAHVVGVSEGDRV